MEPTALQCAFSGTIFVRRDEAKWPRCGYVVTRNAETGRLSIDVATAPEDRAHYPLGGE